MKILFLGDIVSQAGREAVRSELPGVIKSHDPDLILANVENLAGGRGITEETLADIRGLGVDYFTSGDHVFWQKDSDTLLEKFPIVRPANYPDRVSGNGYAVLDLGGKGRVLIINVMGRTFLNERLNDPFTCVDKILDLHKHEKLEAIFVDFHAEATSEKYALGFYLDGRVDVVVGTHTHVPTCDGMALPKGTLFISDAGMNGNIDSVLGVKKEIIQNLYLTAQNQRFEWEDTGRKAFRSVLFDTSSKEVTRIDKILV